LFIRASPPLSVHTLPIFIYSHLPCNTVSKGGGDYILYAMRFCSRIVAFTKVTAKNRDDGGEPTARTEKKENQIFLIYKEI
jgi:hypothetical protein